MAKFHIYWGIKKTPAMPQAAWQKFIDILEGIQPTFDANGNQLTDGTSPYLIGTNDYRENTFQVRHNLNVPFDASIYEANFDDTNLTLEIIRQKLVNAANVADNRITFTTTNQTFVNIPSPIVAYKLDGTVMFRASVFGGLGATWRQSQIECIGFLILNRVEWDGV